ncbi:condensation domain-containing protein [Paracoccus sulfuroxidans]|uniref:Enterobactin synthetase component F n=1 Tax=Paracoccus sulfuroxidans TaxID=384678 RepID=A0A562NGD9_9RHOB|nr:condensation domain-containing protein [Paracoccus sulfuroxidans]TWI31269.1 enterobactin synthetase component F [Paracoccus sulfuroxidans]
MNQHNPTRNMLALTLAQLDFWEEFRHHPDEAVSSVAHAIEIRGRDGTPVDAEALSRAITQTVVEAEVLSIRFHPVEGGPPLQSCDPARAPQLVRFDLSDQPDPLAAALQMFQDDIATPTDLRRDPLAAEWLLRLGADRWLWYNRGHHIILDGFSMGLLETRCAELYAHFRFGTPEGQPFKPFAAYLAEEEAYRRSPPHEAARAYWAERAAEAGTLPTIRKGEENYAEAGYAFEFDLPGPDGRIAALADISGLNWADLSTALVSAYLLGHLDGPHRTPAGAPAAALPVWLPFMSRLGSVSAHIPAMVVNILPLNVRVPSEGTLSGFLAETAKGLRKLRRHGRYRIEQIAEDCGVGAGSRFFFSPLINVLPFDQPQFQGCHATRHVMSSGPNDGLNVTIRAEHDGSGMILQIDADPALMARDEFDRHCRDLRAFLDRALQPESLTLPLTELMTQAS